MLKWGKWGKPDEKGGITYKGYEARMKRLIARSQAALEEEDREIERQERIRKEQERRAKLLAESLQPASGAYSSLPGAKGGGQPKAKKKFNA